MLESSHAEPTNIKTVVRRGYPATEIVPGIIPTLCKNCLCHNNKTNPPTTLLSEAVGYASLNTGTRLVSSHERILTIDLDVLCDFVGKTHFTREFRLGILTVHSHERGPLGCNKNLSLQSRLQIQREAFGDNTFIIVAIPGSVRLHV